MKVKSVEKLGFTGEPVYDLTVKKTHNYLVGENGVVAHNSGVGRCYDDDMMLVDWDNSPTLRCVLDESHADFDFSAHESLRDARHKYGNGKDVLWYTVEDTREGWGKAVEFWENSTFEKIHKDKMLILDFSKIRCKGTPIAGMQNRPASGPVPLMNAFQKAATLKGAGLPRWLQTMYIDHYFAECVLVGGARRCLPEGTGVTTDKGIVPIENIKIGDKIKTALGSYEVKETFNQGIQKTVKIVHDFGELECTKNHRVAIFDKIDSWKFVEAGNLKEGDCLVFDAQVLEYMKESNFFTISLVETIKKEIKDNKTYPVRIKKVIDSGREVQTYDLEIDEIHQFTANGFVVHNSARMSTKYWKDESVLEFITIKRPIEYSNKNIEQIQETQKQLGYKPSGFLWSSNNSIMVDQEFWQLLDLPKTDAKYNSDLVKHARKVFKLSTTAAYGDGTGEPGFINVDKLNFAREGVEALTKSDYMHSSKYKLDEQSQLYISRLIKKAAGKKYFMIVNPCLTADSWIYTSDGTRQIRDLIDKPFNAIVNGVPYPCNTGFFETGEKPVYLIETETSRFIKATLNHKFLRKQEQDIEGWTEVKDLQIGDKLILNDVPLSHILDGQRLVNEPPLSPNKNEPFAIVRKITCIGLEKVYDCTVSGIHCFDANGFISHNCGEIPLAIWGAYCTIADVVPYHANTLDEAEEAFRATVRALIRTNTMDCLYRKEVNRTNRIGVGMTGIHEFAWKFFKLGFRDLIDEEKSMEFWKTISRFKRAVKDEAQKYATKLGVVVPHTDTTIKPSGTVSKLFGLTEGWHLPAMAFYLRWVQFSKDDPLVEIYKQSGYPTRELVKYQNTIIVGFPTCPAISALGMGDKLVTAGEATPEEQYKWLQLGEKYWLRGVDEDAIPLISDTGNNISYTLKYNPTIVDYKSFVKVLKNYQSKIKCCSIMPQEESSSYEYLPEQPMTQAEYENAMSNVKNIVEEDIDFAHIDCKSGACPIDFKKVKE